MGIELKGMMMTIFMLCIFIWCFWRSTETCGTQHISRVRRVISGTSAQAGRWPWQAEIYTWHNSHLCGGALISSKWILSAAHCYSQRSLPDATNKYYVVLGEVDRLVGHAFYPRNDVTLHDIGPKDNHSSTDARSSILYSLSDIRDTIPV